MSKWITPVIDRTIDDVLNARDTLTRWIASNPTEFTEFKGCLNVTDLNRIEGNIDYLNDLLASLHYNTTFIDVKNWTNAGLPNVADLQRILSNITNLFNAICKPTSAEELPTDMSSYDDINRLEQNLQALKQVLDEMQSYFPISGTCIAGSRRLLPLRR